MRVGGKKSNQVSLRGRTGEWMESEGCSTSQWMSPELEKGTPELGEEICGLYADFSTNVPVFVAPCNQDWSVDYHGPVRRGAVSPELSVVRPAVIFIHSSRLVICYDYGTPRGRLERETICGLPTLEPNLERPGVSSRALASFPSPSAANRPIFCV